MGSNGRPAVCYRTCAGALFYCLRIISASVGTKEGLSVCIKAGNISVDRVDTVVVTTLSVLGLVENGRAYYLNLTGTEVSLEVLHIVICIPQTPLYIGENRKLLCFGRTVGELKLLDLAGVIHRNECKDGSLHTIFGRDKAAVANTVAALIRVKLCLGRLPSGIPNGVSILNIEVFTIYVTGNVIVTITGQTK